MNIDAATTGPPDRGPIQIVAVQDAAGLARFIRVAERLGRSDPAYVPPLRSERRDALTAKGNPYFRHASAQFFLACRNGVDVGRISAQRDELVADPTLGQWGLLAAPDDAMVVAALLDAAEGWLTARGLSRAQGPFSLGINEEMGVLIDGFASPPMLLMPHDPPWLAGHIAACGYAKCKDVLAYLCDAAAALPASAAVMVARGLPANVTLRPLNRARLAEDVAALVDIFNDGWADHWGFVPITQDEVAHMAHAMKPILHDRLVWFAEVSGVPAAFGLCLPNLNEAIRDLSGRLLPFGWIKLLWRLKTHSIRTGRVPLMGVRHSLAEGVLGRLLPLHIVEALRREALAMGMRAVEMSWVLEDNLPMRRLAEAVGGRPYKTYRVFEKTLA